MNMLIVVKFTLKQWSESKATFPGTYWYRNLGGTSTVKLSNRGKQLHAKHWSGMVSLVQKNSELIVLNLNKDLDYSI